MKVILLENIRKIGSIGDVIDVKRGFARNYLISQKKGLFCSKKKYPNGGKNKNELNKKDQEKKKNAREIAEKLSNKIFEVEKLTTENKELYGSVKPTEISRLLKEKVNTELNSSLIQPTKEIKSVGKFKVNINLHSEIQSVIYINVVSQEKNN